MLALSRGMLRGFSAEPGFHGSFRLDAIRPGTRIRR